MNNTLGAIEALGAKPPELSAVGLIVVEIANVTPEHVAWLWPGRIPQGKLTLLSGDPGLGKSFLALDIAARVSTGAGWPDGAPSGEPSNVLIASAEDGLADTIAPRLLALKANRARIYSVEAVRDGRGGRHLCLDKDIEKLELAVARVKARLLIVDPIGAFLGEADSHRDAEVRAVLAPLATLAERRRVAILAIAHLNKSAQTAAIYRTGGSIGFVAAARAVHVLASDKRNSQRRIFAPLKNNLAPSAPALAFTIGGAPPAIQWEREPLANLNLDELLMVTPSSRPGPDPEELQAAEDFLADYLGDGIAHSRADVIAAAQGAHISQRTLYRAANALGVTKQREGKPPRSFWRLGNLANSKKSPVTQDNLAKLTNSLCEKDLVDFANLAKSADPPILPSSKSSEERERFVL
jgi:archaellum biogenesis ATPase FlaH